MTDAAPLAPSQHRWQKPDPLLSIIYLIVCLTMLGLGNWQLGRADEKRSMLAKASAAAETDPVPLIDTLNDIAIAASSYTRVKLSGEWLPQQQLLWDNRVASGVAGYEVLTPLKLGNGQVVLVNRGWLPVGASRDVLPDVSHGVTEQGKVISLEGVLSSPSKGLAGGPAIDPSPSWPKRLQYIDYAVMNELYAAPLVPVIVQARRIDAPITEPWHLLANWEPTESFGPSRHLGYAVQWFAMAIALTFLFIWYGLRRPKGNESASNNA